MKKQFIRTMQRMADNETIFQAGDKFWASLYDKLEKGITAGIDPTFIMAYKTLKALDAVENDKFIRRQAQYDKEQQILLSAIDKRIQGRNVYLICSNQTEAKIAEKAFFKLIDVLNPVLRQRGIAADLLAKGAIRFISIDRAECDGFNWGTMRMPGVKEHDAMYLMPSVIDRHFIPFMDAYKRHSQDLELSDFVQGLKVTVEQYYRQSQTEAPAWNVDSMKTEWQIL